MPPTLPETFSVPYSLPVGGTTWTPANAAELQDALDDCDPGDVIELTAGVTYAGTTFTVPNKGADHAWIYIISSARASLPAEGFRVSPADVANMPKITGTPNAVIEFASGANHWRLVGLEITYAAGVATIGTAIIEGLPLPDHIVIDRCYIHGHPVHGVKRGWNIGGAYMACLSSYIDDCWANGFDSQAIATWNGPGPYQIINCHLEGAAENFMSGGSDPSSAANDPADLEFRRNHCFKPSNWMGGSLYIGDDSLWDEIPRTVKNIFELKNMKRALVDGNIFEGHWLGGQQYAIMFTPVNQEDTNPTASIEDITFTNNTLKNCAQWLTLRGTTDNPSNPCGPMARVHIKNNLIHLSGSIDGVFSGGSFIGATYLAIDDLPEDVEISHNTVLGPGVKDDGSTVSRASQFGNDDSSLCPDWIIRDKVWLFGKAGVFSSGGTGTAAYAYALTGHVATPNLWIDNDTHAAWPPTGLYPGTDEFDTLASIITQMEDYDDLVWRLLPGSPWKGTASDATDFGVDMTALLAAQAGESASTPAAESPGPRRGGAFDNRLFHVRA